MRIGTAVALALSLAPAHAVPAADSQTIVWADVEQLLRSRFAIESPDGKNFSWTSQAPLGRSGAPPEARAAVIDLTSREHPEGLRVLQRIGLETLAAMQQAGREDPLGGDLAADSQRFRNALFADERAVRILRTGLARLLEERGITCTDCVLPPKSPREVTFADFVPYLARFVHVGRGDLANGRLGFKVCTGINGLSHLERIDNALAATSLAAMFRASKTPALQRAGGVVRSVRDENPGEETPELRDTINAEVARSLAEDVEFLALLRPIVAEEAKESGFACSDCGPSEVR